MQILTVSFFFVGWSKQLVLGKSLEKGICGSHSWSLLPLMFWHLLLLTSSLPTFLPELVQKATALSSLKYLLKTRFFHGTYRKLANSEADWTPIEVNRNKLTGFNGSWIGSLVIYLSISFISWVNCSCVLKEGTMGTGIEAANCLLHPVWCIAIWELVLGNQQEQKEAEPETALSLKNRAENHNNIISVIIISLWKSIDDELIFLLNKKLPLLLIPICLTQK